MTTSEQAQASLERERNAYWIRKNADKVRRDDRPSRQERIQARQPLPNRKDMRANQSGGMIWSQVARPARPSDELIRAERLRAARRKAKEEAGR